MLIKTPFGEYIKGGIYQHYNNLKYYRILEVALLHDSAGIYLIIYHECDINGIYVSIRDTDGNPKVHQPFATHETRWNEYIKQPTKEDAIGLKRFTLIKENP